MHSWSHSMALASTSAMMRPMISPKTPRLYLRGKHIYGTNFNMENPLGTIASIEYALRRLDKDAEEEKAKCERMEKALADYREQLDRPFEHEERLRELCLKQQEMNRLLDLDKSNVQAAANDNVPQDEQAAETFMERLTARRTERRQVRDLEVVA